MFQKKTTTAPLDKNGNYDIPNIEVGQIMSGKRILSIPIHDKEPGKQRIIFITEDYQLVNINYEKQIPEVAKHESLINQCEENICRLKGRKLKIQLLILLANYKQALFIANDENSYGKVSDILVDFLEKIKTEIKVQYQYFNVITTVFVSILLISFVHYINLIQLFSSISSLLLNGIIFSLVGMIASTIYSRISIGKLNKIISYRFGYAIIDSVLRIILSISVVIIFYIGFKSKLFLNFENNSHQLFLFFASICGFSEHFVPDLLVAYSKMKIVNSENDI